MIDRVFVPMLVVAAMAVSAHADPYRLTFTGQIDSFSDTRSAGSDLFAGTGLAEGLYTPQAGDTLSFAIDYDSDLAPDPDSPDAAIYSHLSWTMSLAGVTVQGGPAGNIYYYYDAGDQLQVMEIFGLFDPAPGLGGIAGIEFSEPSLVPSLIHGGLLPTDAAMFDGLSSTALFFFSNNGDFSVAASQFKVSVIPIPAPGPVCMVLVVGSFGTVHRRRAQTAAVARVTPA